MTQLYEPPTEGELVAEFLAAPRGPHSPELQHFLKVLLADVSARDAVLVALVPFRRWALATLPRERGQRVEIERERTFEDEEEAMRALFLRRLERRRAGAAARGAAVR